MPDVLLTTTEEFQKEGRKKYYICSSRLGLIRWDIIQHVKAVHHKVSNTSDVQLPHELLLRVVFNSI